MIPLDNKKEYSIKDFEGAEITDMGTLLGSGHVQIGSEQALWKKVYMETSGVLSNKLMKEMLSAPSFMFRESEKNAVLYSVQIVRNNHLYTIGCTALDSTKELSLKRFDNYKDLFSEMVQSFSFEKGQYHSPEHNLYIGIPDGWSKSSPRQGVLAIYGKAGSGENFIIRVNTVPSSTKIENLTWQRLFYSQYGSLHIEKEDSIETNGKTFKYCVYKIIDQRLKKQLEGKYDLKYMAVTFMNGSKLYVITFTDRSDNFKNNFPVFMNTSKSIRFE